MKRQGNILNFLRKIPRTESSVEEATEIAIDDIYQWFSTCGTRTTNGTRGLFRWYAVVDIG